MSKTIIVGAIFMFSAAQALADDVTYRKDIRPLWDAKCSACHGAASPYLGEFLENQDKYVKMMKGPRMDTYADMIFYVGWPDTGAIMRRLDDGKNIKGGKAGNMYQYLGATEEERQANLNLFKQWVGVDAWTHKRWNAKGDMPGVTKEELDKMKVKY
jgi:hypothetical protein